MNRSEQINELAKALAAAQLEMRAAPKSRENPHFKSKYAPLNEVIDVAKVLAKHGLAFVQPASADAQMGVVTVETILIHSSGQWLSESMSLKPQQNTPQGIGSALTYGRRYGLSSLVGIAADDDDDGNAASAKNGNGAHATQPPLAAEDQRKTVAEWKAEMEAAPNKVALQGVAARIARAKDAGLLNEADVEKELNPVWAAKIKALNGQAKA